MRVSMHLGYLAKFMRTAEAAHDLYRFHAELMTNGDPMLWIVSQPSSPDFGTILWTID